MNQKQTMIIVAIALVVICLSSSSAAGLYYYYHRKQSSSDDDDEDKDSSSSKTPAASGSSTPAASGSSTAAASGSSTATWQAGTVASTEVPYDKQARDCTDNGGVYTAGTNDRFPGCGGAWCCVPSTPAWDSGKKTTEYTWKPGTIVSTNDPYDKQARDCTGNGGVYTGGSDNGFPGCDGAWCCAHSS